MKNRVSNIIFIIIILFRLSSALGYLYFTLPYNPHSDYTGVLKRFVYIEPGSNLQEISRQLYMKKIISNQKLFTWLVRLSGKANKIMAGEYVFLPGASLSDVYNKLTKGEVYLHRITIPEGADLMDIAEIFQEQGICSRDEFLHLTSNNQSIAGIAPNAKNLEGFLFPDTYYYARGIKPEALIKMMHQKFTTAFNSLMEESNKSLDLDVVILASLIEKETSIPEEKPLISSVFSNRLKRNIPLQCDPTIIYALKKENRYDGNLKRAHLKLDSPYNTYLYPGLPIGPICNPDIQSLLSALQPPETDYLYFVSKNDGSHYFSNTLSEHNRAVAQYQKLYWKNKWNAERTKINNQN